MLILLTLLMAYLLIGETAHEWLGLTMFLLFILHHIMNPAWLKTLFKGRVTLLRIYLTGVGGMFFARTVHLLLSHWGFILMSVHVGNHAGTHRAGKKKGVTVLLWTVRLQLMADYASMTCPLACTACCPERIAVKDLMRELAMQQCKHGNQPAYVSALK